VEIPIKLASRALKLVQIDLLPSRTHVLIRLCSILRPVIPVDVEGTNSYYFLRRLLITPHLPYHLRQNIQQQDGYPTIHLLIPPPIPSMAEDIVNALKPHIEAEYLPVVRITKIPLDPPTSSEQAALWSKNYWPCTFNPASQTLQKAPPLHVLRTVQAGLNKEASLESYFGLANLAATKSVQFGIGRDIAAIVVDPVKEEVVAVAGDARWFGKSREVPIGGRDCNGLAEGRAEYHALMRVIAMVADKDQRRRTGKKDSSSITATEQDNDLEGKAITPIEKLYAATNPEMLNYVDRFMDIPAPQPTERPDGYLCNGLDVYLTHEPCVACSMAMVHSRFRACIFQRRMPRSGGLCAEKYPTGLSYGLFWRKELNWRVLTFQYLPDSALESGLGKAEKTLGHGGEQCKEAMFHA
jgi:tRNA-specific adenosine deaminase 3